MDNIISNEEISRGVQPQRSGQSYIEFASARETGENCLGNRLILQFTYCHISANLEVRVKMFVRLTLYELESR